MCGTSPVKHIPVNVVPGGGSGLLSISPNPTSGETTISIETAPGEKTGLEPASASSTFDDEEWDMEIYTNAQTLKTKKTNLKGNSTSINTSGWKEGVYMVRINYNGEMLTGKLVVKN